MYVTASPTVCRLLTSSSGIFTSKRSSAATTTSTMDSESTSRSSVKDLSSWTSSTGMPAISFTISARPSTISSCVAAMMALLRWCSEVYGSAHSGRTGGERRLGESNDRRGVDETRPEADDECRVAALGLARRQKPLHRERDRRGRGVAGGLDVTGDRD